jgi:hypothetical protein
VRDHNPTGPIDQALHVGIALRAGQGQMQLAFGLIECHQGRHQGPSPTTGIPSGILVAVTKQMISFTDPQRQYLIREAKRLGISIAELVRRIIDRHIETAK